MKRPCYLVTTVLLIALLTAPGCHPLSAEQRSAYATEGAAFRITLTYEAAHPHVPEMPQPEDLLRTAQAEHAAYTPRPTATITPWPTFTQAMPSTVKSICLTIEQSFESVKGEMPDPRPFAVRILENSGYAVVDSNCDATLDVQLILSPLSEEYSNLGGSGSSTCYTGARATGPATLTIKGKSPQMVQVNGVRSPTSGFFVIISDCPSQSKAPFDTAARNALFSAMLQLVGTGIFEGAMLDEDPNVRSYTIWQIWDLFCQTGYNGSFDLLVEALDDPETTVKSAALTILGFMDETADPAYEKILSMLQDPDPDIRCRVIDALSRIRRKDPALIDPMIAALKDPDEDVAFAALGQLESIGPEALRAVPAVLEYYGTHPGDKYYVTACLRSITGENLGDDPLAWQTWWEQNHATAAP